MAPLAIDRQRFTLRALKSSSRKILVIRQDNIGDLVCTTPLFEGIHTRFPGDRLTVLCTTYNQAVLDRNPHVSGLAVYSKQSHHDSMAGVVRGAMQKAMMILRLRREKFDIVIVPSTPCSARVAALVRNLRPKRFVRSEGSEGGGDNLPGSVLQKKHEVERGWEFGRQIGLGGSPPPVKVYPDPPACEALRGRVLDRVGNGVVRRLIAVHISSRKPSQQWPVESFEELIRALHHADPSLGFVLLWAPGHAGNRAHAGDDEKLAILKSKLPPGMPVHSQPTPDLKETISALGACDYFVGSDGGAMHLAAGCGLPGVAFFGDSSFKRWRPWNASYEVIQPATKNVQDISPREAVAAFLRVAGPGR